MLGTLSRASDGRFALEFIRELAHPQAKVWRALTEVDQLRGWFVEMLDYDRSSLNFAESAELTFIPQADRQLPIGKGRVTKIDAPRLLEYTWDKEILRWELEPKDNSACRLIFTNIFPDRVSAIEVAPGWHLGLDLLEAFLADPRNTPNPLTSLAWEHLQSEYERALK